MAEKLPMEVIYAAGTRVRYFSGDRYGESYARYIDGIVTGYSSGSPVGVPHYWIETEDGKTMCAARKDVVYLPRAGECYLKDGGVIRVDAVHPFYAECTRISPSGKREVDIRLEVFDKKDIISMEVYAKAERCYEIYLSTLKSIVNGREDKDMVP